MANLLSLEKKFKKDPELKTRYDTAMEDYFQQGHAHIANNINLESHSRVRVAFGSNSRHIPWI